MLGVGSDPSRPNAIMLGDETANMDRHPDVSRLVKTIRAALTIQVLGMVVGILLASPSFFDRLLRQTTTGLDFRGLDFALWAVFFGPLAVLLGAATWGLRPSRIWAAVLPLIVDLIVLALLAYAFLAAIAQPSTNPDAPPLPVEILQVLLVLIPAVVTLILVVVLLNMAYGSANRQVQLTRDVLVAQAVAMVACVALSSPSLSDRLSNMRQGNFAGLGFEGFAFALWTLFLAPAGLVLLAAAWQLNRQQQWTRLAPLVVDTVLLGVLGLAGLSGNWGPPGSRLDPSPYPLGMVQVLLVVIPAVVSGGLVLALMNDTREGLDPQIETRPGRQGR